MKVLFINGSPHKEGNTYLALNEVAKIVNAEGLESEIVWIGNKPVRGCIACFKCMELGHCVFRDDLMVEFEEKVKQADAIVVGSPTYYAGPNGSLCAILDRLFLSQSKELQYKPAAAVAICRRGGATATFERLNKYFMMTNMPVVTSQYWNLVYGMTPGEVEKDGEGMQTMRTLGRNLVWMLKNLQSGAATIPQPEDKVTTNFIR